MTDHQPPPLPLMLGSANAPSATDKAMRASLSASSWVDLSLLLDWRDHRTKSFRADSWIKIASTQRDRMVQLDQLATPSAHRLWVQSAVKA
jgi:hypothetical protein